MRIGLVLLAGLLGFGGAPRSDVEHVEDASRDPRASPASLETIQKQLDDTDQFLGERTAARLVVWDATAATSQAEHDDIGHGMLILTLATAEAESDLPLRRVWVTGAGDRQMPLILVGTLPRQQLRTLRISGRTGTHVWAGVFYLSRARQTAQGPLFADFPARSGFKLGLLPTKIFRTFEDKGQVRVYLGNVARVALREYPGLELAPDFRKALQIPERAPKQQ